MVWDQAGHFGTVEGKLDRFSTFGGSRGLRLGRAGGSGSQDESIQADLSFPFSPHPRLGTLVEALPVHEIPRFAGVSPYTKVRLNRRP